MADVWPVWIETAGWQVQGDEPALVGAAVVELRPVYANPLSARPYEVLLVGRVAGLEVVFRLAPRDVEQMHAALCGAGSARGEVA